MTSWQQLRIDQVNPADQGAFTDFYDVSTASQVHDRPDTFTPPGLKWGATTSSRLRRSWR